MLIFLSVEYKTVLWGIVRLETNTSTSLLQLSYSREHTFWFRIVCLFVFAV